MYSPCFDKWQLIDWWWYGFCSSELLKHSPCVLQAPCTDSQEGLIPGCLLSSSCESEEYGVWRSWVTGSCGTEFPAAWSPGLSQKISGFEFSYFQKFFLIVVPNCSWSIDSTESISLFYIHRPFSSLWPWRLHWYISSSRNELAGFASQYAEIALKSNVYLPAFYLLIDKKLLRDKTSVVYYQMDLFSLTNELIVNYFYQSPGNYHVRCSSPVLKGAFLVVG